MAAAAADEPAERPAASENREAADIIAAGVPDGRWLSSERVHDLLTPPAEGAEWRLPVSDEMKEDPKGERPMC